MAVNLFAYGFIFVHNMGILVLTVVIVEGLHICYLNGVLNVDIHLLRTNRFRNTQVFYQCQIDVLEKVSRFST
jgi:hypothetical protein